MGYTSKFTGQEIDNLLTQVQEGGSSGGLKYSEERTLYVYDLTDEQKAYNAETYNKLINEGCAITINYHGMILTFSGMEASGEGAYLSVTAAAPDAVLPVIFILHNDGTVSIAGDPVTIPSDVLYVPIVGGELGESEKQNNIRALAVWGIKRIRVVPEPGSTYGLESTPIGVDVGDILLFFRYGTMYKATVDFTTGEVETEVVGTLTAPTA